MNENQKELPPSAFPALLGEMADPPKQLFVRGTLPPEGTPLLTVVGSRKYSAYGKAACEKIIGELAGSGIGIVSGLALGIVSIAHHAALAAKLPTIAVPGSGLATQVLYPASNRGLAERIVRNGGALLSEFEPNFRATVWSFPQRNRIMAALSPATLIIEAGERSGTLITARLALEYNRDVYAVPGSIFSNGSHGTNDLIRNGALPVSSGADILHEFGLTIPESEDAGVSLPPLEENIFAAIDEPRSIDEIARMLKLPTSKISISISSMEIKGVIKRHGEKICRMHS